MHVRLRFVGSLFGPDGLRRSARIGHAALNGSGMGASPPVSHIASVHCLRLFTSGVCPLPAYVHSLRLLASCVVQFPRARDRTARAVPLELVMRRSIVAEWAQALRCVTLRLSTARVCPLPASIRFLRRPIPSRPGPDGSRRAARIGHAALNGSGMGASPPVSHIASVHYPRLSTAQPASIRFLRRPIPSRPGPDGLCRAARIGHAAFNGSGMGASPPVSHIASVHCLRLSTARVCPQPASARFLRRPIPSRPGPDGLRRAARIGHAAFNRSGMGASPPVCHIASVHCPRLSTACVCSLPASSNSLAPRTGRLAPCR